MKSLLRNGSELSGIRQAASLELQKAGQARLKAPFARPFPETPLLKNIAKAFLAFR